MSAAAPHPDLRVGGSAARVAETALAGSVGLLWLVGGICLAAGVPAVLPRPVHRLLHEAGAVLFLGNVVIAAGWFTLATFAKSTRVLRFAIRGVNWADVVFTVPGALLLVVNGAALAPGAGGYGVNWLNLGAGVFVAAGVLWSAVLVPIQLRLARMLETAPEADPMVSVRGLKRLVGIYSVVGGAVGVGLIGSFVAMVLKVPR